MEFIEYNYCFEAVIPISSPECSLQISSKCRRIKENETMLAVVLFFNLLTCVMSLLENKENPALQSSNEIKS
jgi:hypothetical protein